MVQGTPVRSWVPVYPGERIRAVRLLVGTSRADRAAALGVTQAETFPIESGRRTATAAFFDPDRVEHRTLDQLDQ